jgi:hypothetical protein
MRRREAKRILRAIDRNYRIEKTNISIDRERKRDEVREGESELKNK